LIWHIHISLIMNSLFVFSISSALAQLFLVLGETCNNVQCHWSLLDIFDDGALAYLQRHAALIQEKAKEKLLVEDSPAEVQPAAAAGSKAEFGAPRSSEYAIEKPTQHAEVAEIKPKRVAVVTSGTAQRYLMQSACQGLLQPLARQGHEVHYFLALSTEGFHPNVPSAARYVMDPAVPWTQSPMQFINQTVSKTGATAKAILLVNETDIGEEVEQAFIMRAKLNVHGGKHVRMSLVKMLKMLDKLRVALEKEEAKSGAYDRVIWAKDDGLWLKQFDLNQLERYSPGSEPRGLNGWNLICDQQWSSWDARIQGGLTEYILVLERKAAIPYLSSYSNLLKSEYWNLIDLEHFMKVLSTKYNVQFHSVPPTVMPMQRGAHTAGPNGTVVVCLHKACDSCDTVSHDRLYPEKLYARCGAVLTEPVGSQPDSTRHTSLQD